MQHAGGEEDEDPGVDDGVDRDEAEGEEIQRVRLIHLVRHRVDVDADH